MGKASIGCILYILCTYTEVTHVGRSCKCYNLLVDHTREVARDLSTFCSLIELGNHQFRCLMSLTPCRAKPSPNLRIMWMASYKTNFKLPAGACVHYCIGAWTDVLLSLCENYLSGGVNKHAYAYSPTQKAPRQCMSAWVHDS
jgi:hypothetical protein